MQHDITIYPPEQEGDLEALLTLLAEIIVELASESDLQSEARAKAA